jgi:hypothetical protein
VLFPSGAPTSGRPTTYRNFGGFKPGVELEAELPPVPVPGDVDPELDPDPLPALEPVLPEPGLVTGFAEAGWFAEVLLIEPELPQAIIQGSKEKIAITDARRTGRSSVSNM